MMGSRSAVGGWRAAGPRGGSFNFLDDDGGDDGDDGESDGSDGDAYSDGDSSAASIEEEEEGAGADKYHQRPERGERRWAHFAPMWSVVLGYVLIVVGSIVIQRPSRQIMAPENSSLQQQYVQVSSPALPQENVSSLRSQDRITARQEKNPTRVLSTDHESFEELLQNNQRQSAIAAQEALARLWQTTVSEVSRREGESIFNYSVSEKVRAKRRPAPPPPPPPSTPPTDRIPPWYEETCNSAQQLDKLLALASSISERGHDFYKNMVSETYTGKIESLSMSSWAFQLEGATSKQKGLFHQNLISKRPPQEWLQKAYDEQLEVLYEEERRERVERDRFATGDSNGDVASALSRGEDIEGDVVPNCESIKLSSEHLPSSLTSGVYVRIKDDDDAIVFRYGQEQDQNQVASYFFYAWQDWWILDDDRSADNGVIAFSPRESLGGGYWLIDAHIGRWYPAPDFSLACV